MGCSSSKNRIYEIASEAEKNPSAAAKQMVASAEQRVAEKKAADQRSAEKNNGLSRLEVCRAEAKQRVAEQNQEQV